MFIYFPAIIVLTWNYEIVSLFSPIPGEVYQVYLYSKRNINLHTSMYIWFFSTSVLLDCGCGWGAVTAEMQRRSSQFREGRNRWLWWVVEVWKSHNFDGLGEKGIFFLFFLFLFLASKFWWVVREVSEIDLKSTMAQHHTAKTNILFYKLHIQIGINK